VSITKRTILIVDDDEELCSALVEQFSIYEEFQTLHEGTAGKAIQAVRRGIIDLVIMDVGLPDMDGRDAVKILRRSDYKAPIIMLTAQATDSDTVLGLEAGANDYVTKPFRIGVLLARIRAQLRQYENTEYASLQIGTYTFQPSKKLLIDERGKEIRLTEKEAAILKHLYRADQKIVPRKTLLEQVWGYTASVTTHTLETHVYRLRQKMEQDPANAKILVSERGGYKLSSTCAAVTAGASPK
jgi:DNA-binding response OmpR family regulator